MPLISLQRKPSRHLVVSVLSVGLLGVSWGRLAADDSPAFGEPLPGLTTEEHQAFEIGLEDFLEVETVEDGLGPVFNERSCAACHSVPAIGGDSTVIETRFGTHTNEQFDPLLSGGGSLLQTDGIGPVGDCVIAGETIPPEAHRRGRAQIHPALRLRPDRGHPGRGPTPAGGAPAGGHQGPGASGAGRGPADPTGALRAQSPGGDPPAVCRRRLPE